MQLKMPESASASEEAALAASENGSSESADPRKPLVSLNWSDDLDIHVSIVGTAVQPPKQYKVRQVPLSIVRTCFRLPCGWRWFEFR